MKNSMKKAVIIALVGMLCVSGVFANGSKEAASSASKTYKVGVCQLVQHPALDQATQGFQDAIKRAMGDGVKFDVQNASGDSATCITIVNGFVSSNDDLIMCNATPALQAAQAATGTIPVLGTSVTDYGSALGITLKADGSTGINISGTSDLTPLDKQAQMFKELLPNAKTIGILYCTAEANSVYQANEIEKDLKALGYKTVRCTFTDSNDVASVVADACTKVDALYIPTDNTAASCTESIRNVVEPAKMPVIAGEEGICVGCGVATLSIDYYNLGYATGEQAVKILTEGADVSKMPIIVGPNPVYKYNADLCKVMGVTVPANYVAL